MEEIILPIRKVNLAGEKRSKENIISQTISIIGDILDISKGMITPEASISNDLFADTRDYESLLLDCQKTFNIAIYDDEAEKIATAQDLWDCITAIISAEGRLIK
jgi:acyl carrier protein